MMILPSKSIEVISQTRRENDGEIGDRSNFGKVRRRWQSVEASARCHTDRCLSGHVVFGYIDSSPSQVVVKAVPNHIPKRCRIGQFTELERRLTRAKNYRVFTRFVRATAVLRRFTEKAAFKFLPGSTQKLGRSKHYNFTISSWEAPSCGKKKY